MEDTATYIPTKEKLLVLIRSARNLVKNSNGIVLFDEYSSYKNVENILKVLKAVLVDHLAASGGDLIEFISSPRFYARRTSISNSRMVGKCIHLHNRGQTDMKRATGAHSEGHQRRIILNLQNVFRDFNPA